MCMQVALDILKAGGSAVDAAIAANAMEGVVEPMMNGILSKSAWLHTMLNASVLELGTSHAPPAHLNSPPPLHPLAFTCDHTLTLPTHTPALNQ